MTITFDDRDIAGHAPSAAVLDLRKRYADDIGVRPVAADVTTADMLLDGIPAIDVRTPGVRDDGVLLWVHGGAYVAGFARAAVGLAGGIARGARIRAASVEYRLAPEHPFPAPLDDVLTAYRALLHEGVPVDRIAFGGESAGGGLVLSALVALRDAGEPLPAAAVVLSPWTDLSLSGGSIATKASADPVLSEAALRPDALDYLAGCDARDPRISTAFADLTGLPPLAVHVGSHEVLLDDAVRLAARAAEADVQVELTVYPREHHGFEHGEMADASSRASLHAAGEFLRRQLDR